MLKEGEQLDLNLIPVFDALLKHRNVTRAAAALEMSQSGVSHALSRLRDFFGDPLFVRNGAGVAPTARAESLAVDIAEILEIVDQKLLSPSAFEPYQARRTLTICMPEMGELLMLPELMAAIRQRAPRCKVRTFQVPSAETCEYLASGEADLAIGNLPSTTAQIYQQKLYAHGRVVVGHADADPGGVLDLDAYCAARHVAVDPYACGLSPIDGWLAEQRRTRDIALVVQHYLVIPQLIAGDPDLIATLPGQILPAVSAHTHLKVRPCAFEFPRIEVFQYWHARSQKDDFHIWLRSLVADAFMKHPGLNT